MNIRQSPGLLVILTGGGIAVAVAQTLPLTLQNALQTGLNNYQSVKAKENYAKAAAVNVTATRQEFLPDLNLAANFQSFKVAFVIVSTIPAVLAGSLIMLLLTGSTLNLQSYMGIIMSVGVSVANAILLVTNAEKLRLENQNACRSVLESAAVRLRPEKLRLSVAVPEVNTGGL